MTPVKPRPGRIATISEREGSEAVKDRASARMPLGSSAGRAASSRPDAGPRLSDGRPGPPLGGTGGRNGRPSPATTRQRPEADRVSTPTPAGSLHGSRLATDDPSSPAAQIALQRHRQETAVAGSTRMTRTDSLRGRGGSLRCCHRCRQRLGTLIQLDRTEPAIAAERHVGRTCPAFSTAPGAVRAAGDSSASTGTPCLHQSVRRGVRRCLRHGIGGNRGGIGLGSDVLEEGHDPLVGGGQLAGLRSVGEPGRIGLRST